MTISTVPPRSKFVRFPIQKDHFRRIEIEPGVTIYHLYPTLAAWVGREVPDDVNPRSHEENALNGSVPAAIEHTIVTHPEDFYLANRGETVLASAVVFDPEAQTVEIILPDCEGDAAQHGVADGATTDAVISRVQRAAAGTEGRSFRELALGDVPPHLRAARVHIEVIVGLEDRDRIQRLVQGRNTSRQVKTWTIADFSGTFDWLKAILERDGGPFKGKIGYEENAATDVNILEVLAILTLFHPQYDIKGKAPTVAYSSKGRMDKRLMDPNNLPGYKVLAPIMEDILRLHDFVYARFHQKYKEAFPGGKLGRRGKTDDRIFQKMPKALALTGEQSEYLIPAGVLYPLLAALRALVCFPDAFNGGATWKLDAFEFFERAGSELVENLISQLEVLQNNPQTMGKTRTVYTSLHDRARLLVAEAELGARSTGS